MLIREPTTPGNYFVYNGFNSADYGVFISGVGIFPAPERIVDVLSRLHRLFPKAKIVGHRDLPGTTPKECPCLDAHALFGWIEEL